MKIASEISEAKNGEFELVSVADNAVAKSAYELRSKSLTDIARPFTFAGSGFYLTFVTVLTAGILFWKRNYWRACQLIFCGIGAAAISHYTKSFFDRQRPSDYPLLDHVTSLSYPSGHSLGSMAVYLSIGLILNDYLENRFARYLAIGAVVLLSLLIGLTRIYLGVHYFTDVIAGHMLGAAWAIFCWDVINSLRTKTSKVH